MTEMGDRWRPAYLRRMLSLALGEGTHVYPEEGDTIDLLFQRLRRQATRYRRAGMHFHLLKRPDHVLVHRVPQGLERKLSPFLTMKVPDKVICEEPLETERQHRNLMRRLSYLSGKGVGIWIEQHPDGTRFFRCFMKSCEGEPFQLWHETLEDDGSDLQGVRVLCCPFGTSEGQHWLSLVNAALRKRRANATFNAPAVY